MKLFDTVGIDDSTAGNIGRLVNVTLEGVARFDCDLMFNNKRVGVPGLGSRMIAKINMFIANGVIIKVVYLIVKR